MYICIYYYTNFNIQHIFYISIFLDVYLHRARLVSRLVESLLRRGADVSARSNDGESALHVVPGGYAELEVPVAGYVEVVVLVVPFAAKRRKCQSGWGQGK